MVFYLFSIEHSAMCVDTETLKTKPLPVSLLKVPVPRVSSSRHGIDESSVNTVKLVLRGSALLLLLHGRLALLLLLLEVTTHTAAVHFVVVVHVCNKW